MTDRVALASTSTGRQIYSTKPNASSSPWTRNPDLWSSQGLNPIDFTGVAGYVHNINYGTYVSSRIGTLISPRHVLSATHWPPNPGEILGFIDADGNHIQRTVTGHYNVGGDITVALLNADLPDSITYYPLIASSTFESLVRKIESNIDLDIPLVSFNQQPQALIKGLLYATWNPSYSTLVQKTYTSGDFAGYSSNIIGGDSGSPTFIIIDGQPVLLSAFYSGGGGSGPNYGSYISQINTAMTALGGGYQVTEYTPNCFTQYTLNHNPVFTSNNAITTLVIQNPSTAIHTVIATDSDLDTISYSLQSLTSVSSTTLALTPSDYFSISSSTGQIRQLQTINNNITGNSLILTVRAEDDNTYVASTTQNITVSIDYPVLQNAAVTGSVVELKYSNNLSTSSVPATTDFSIVVNGVARSVTNVTINANYVYLNLASPIALGDSVKVLYSIANNPLKDTAGAYASTVSSTSPLYVANSHNGDIDPTFDPGTGANQGVYAVAIQTDQKIVIGGGFTTYNGISISGIARLNSNGSLDTSFNPGTGTNGGYVNDLAILSNGKIMIVGGFSEYNGVSINKIARLNSNGSLDTSFDPGTGFTGGPTKILVTSTGKYLVLGDFTSYNGSNYSRIIQLNSDGTVDSSFTPGTGTNLQINNASLESNGDILIAGNFTTYNGVNRSNFARINSDGSLDTGFNATSSLSQYIDGGYAIQKLSTGKYVVGGLTTYITENIPGAILNSDGSLYAMFDQNFIGDGVFDLYEQPDGKIIVHAYNFYLNSSVSQNGIGRITPEGIVDQTFISKPGASLGGNGNIAIQSDGNIIMVGIFTSYNSIARKNIVRIVGQTSTGGSTGGSSGGGSSGGGSSGGGGGGGGAVILTNFVATTSNMLNATSANTSVKINKDIAVVSNINNATRKILIDQVFTVGGKNSFRFNKNLSPLTTIARDAKKLQIFLNIVGFKVAAVGAGSPGYESTRFGPATKAALARFQKSVGISPSIGNFGPITRAYVNAYANMNSI